MNPLEHTVHRPWPLPRQPWVMHMRWCDLLFAHWPVPPAWLRPHVPAGLELQSFEGSAWIGVVPFRMENVRPRLVPPVPGWSAFPELNVRTYVSAGGKPGVWFFSLEAAQPLAVRLARSFFHLPYMDARMQVGYQDDWVRYVSTRTHQGEPEAEFQGRYRPLGPVYRSHPGTLEHWLTERYCLYSADARGQIWRGEIHHPPWPLQAAEAELEANRMTQPIGFELPLEVPLLHFAQRLDVVAWLIQPV